MSSKQNQVEFGWGAKPFIDQFPSMDKSAAANFDKDNEAMIRLRLRGYLTDSQRDQVMKKIANSVGKSISSSTPS